jgi:hypothetical protein
MLRTRTSSQGPIVALRRGTGRRELRQTLSASERSSKLCGESESAEAFSLSSEQ